MFAMLLLSSTMFITSCSKDEAAIAANEKFIGSYIVNDNCTADEIDCSGSQTYTMVIRASGSNDIYIDNYFRTFNNVFATVSGNTFTVSEVYGITDKTGTEQWDINSGSGTLSGNSLVMSGHADDILFDYSCGQVNCTASATKN